jgi:hypothetical protein
MNTVPLDLFDVDFCVKRLPFVVHDVMHKHPIIVAGGFIRSCVAKEPISDIDVVGPSKSAARELAHHVLDAGENKRVYDTDNAYTVTGSKLMWPVQFIHRWVYDSAESAIRSFDFTVCAAAIWYDREQQKFLGICDDRFYPDLAAHRLRYTSPERVEDVGGSLLRLFKFYRKNYTVDLYSLAKVVGRFAANLPTWDEKNAGLESKEEYIARLSMAALKEVDPGGFLRGDIAQFVEGLPEIHMDENKEAIQ